MIGFANGGYIRMCLRENDPRPVRDSIIHRVHQLKRPGAATWFANLLTPLVAQDIAATAPSVQAWPFERITPEQWAKLTARQQGAIEDAAVQKLRDVARPDEDEGPLFARAAGSSRKRQAAGQ